MIELQLTWEMLTIGPELLEKESHKLSDLQYSA